LLSIQLNRLSPKASNGFEDSHDILFLLFATDL
jgi:hypothetical protein